jgi:hypothetical protein
VSGKILAVSISDTTPEVQAMPFDIFGNLSGEQYIDIALHMSLFARALREACIRHNHPDWSEHQVKCELIRWSFYPDPLPPWLEARLATESSR